MNIRHVILLVGICLTLQLPASPKTYNLTLIARQGLETGSHDRGHVHDTALRTLKAMNIAVLRSNRRDGIIISRANSFRVRLSGMGGSDADDSGNQTLDCMIAHRFREGNLESLGERLLNRFVNAFKAELSSHEKYPHP